MRGWAIVLDKLIRQWRGLRTSGFSSEDFMEERRFHIEMETERYVAEGMDRESAKKRASLAFGNANDLGEQVREELGWAWLGDAWRDLIFGARVLRRRLGFAFSVTVTLSLCLGANMTFYAALRDLVLADLPFKEPNRLVEVYRSEKGNDSAKHGGNLSLRNEYAGQEDLFEEVSFFRGKWSNLKIGSQQFRGNILSVSPSFFDTLGVDVFRGEALNDNASDGAAWLSRSLWESTFASDESVLGKAFLLDGEAHQIVGIAPREAERVAEGVSVFVRIEAAELISDPLDESARSDNNGVIWGRLVDGISNEQVEQRLSQLEQRFQERSSSLYRESNDSRRSPLEVVPVQQVRTRWASSRLYLLNAGALLVLAIGCMNAGNLLLAQANARGEEYWVRRMLGARVGRIVRQCWAETALLLAIAWAGGVVVAFFGVHFLAAFSGELFRQRGAVTLGLETLLYGVFVASACLIALGSIVGTRAVSASKQAENEGSSYQSTPGLSSRFLRSGLAMGQTALTLALLVGGGLLAKSFYMVTNQDFGFESDGVVTARIHLVEASYEEESRREAFKGQLLQGLKTQPGVEEVSLSSTIPTFGFPDQFVVKHDPSEGEPLRRTYLSYISPAHLRTLGIALLEGRDFLDTDEFGWQTPVLVDERFARVFYPGESALGKRVNLGRRPRNENNWPIIVGVVESTKQTALDGDDGMPLLYFPIKGSWVDEFSVFVKTEGSVRAALGSIESEVKRLDVGMPIYRSGTLDSVMAESLTGRRGLLWLCVGLGAVALALSAVGVYGGASFRVSQRLREFAIRVAIGATESRVISENVAHDLKLTAWGLALGLLFSLQASRFLTAWLYGVDRFDWQTYAGLTLIVAFIYGLFSYLPSRSGVRRNKVRL